MRVTSVSSPTGLPVQPEDLAHALNDAMGLLRAHLDLLRLDVGAESPSKAHLDGLEQAARQVGTLVSGLVASGRSSSGRFSAGSTVAWGKTPIEKGEGGGNGRGQRDSETTVIAGERARVLYVDDEVGLAKVMEKVLQRLGYRATSMSNVLEALACLRADPGRFDVVITDFAMPLMDGIQFCQRVRQLRRDLPMVLVSGYSPRLNAAETQLLGFRSLLWKPLTLDQLGEALKLVLNSPLASGGAGR